MNRQTVGVVLVLVAAGCFGTLAIFGKVAEDIGINTITLLTYRFVIGSIFIWGGLFIWRRARILPPRARRFALALGILYAIFSWFFFWSLLYIPAGVASLVFFTYPVYVYVLSMVVLDEILTQRKVVALVLALAGIVLIVGGDPAGVNVVGVVLMMIAALGNALYIIGNRAALASIDADVLVGTAMISTAISFVAVGLVSGQLQLPTGGDQWAVIVGIAAIGTALPLFLYVSGLERIPASHASILGTAEPVVTVILGFLLLDEQLTVAILVGGVLILGGVLLIRADLGPDKPAR